MTFEESFHEIERTKVGGGPKSTGADEITWRGQLNGKPCHLVTRVRLNNPMESFMTPSNMRLRDSFVGRGGHWIDAKVRGFLSDPELEQLRAMMQAADPTRTVYVRRI